MSTNQHEIKPFTYELYSSFFIRPKLVDDKGNPCKIEYIYLAQDSTIKDIAFIKLEDKSRIKAEDVYIVVPSKSELEAAMNTVSNKEKTKSEFIY